MKIVPSFIDAHFVPNPYEFLSFVQRKDWENVHTSKIHQNLKKKKKITLKSIHYIPNPLKPYIKCVQLKWNLKKYIK